LHFCVWLRSLEFCRIEFIKEGTFYENLGLEDVSSLSGWVDRATRNVLVLEEVFFEKVIGMPIMILLMNVTN